MVMETPLAGEYRFEFHAIVSDADDAAACAAVAATDNDAFIEACEAVVNKITTKLNCLNCLNCLNYWHVIRMFIYCDPDLMRLMKLMKLMRL